MTESIFPFITSSIIDQISSQNLTIAKEWAWDFDTSEFVIKNGKFVEVTGLEAVKVQVWKALKTARYRYLIYSWNYGNELENLIGKGFTPAVLQSEAARYVREALSPCPYVQDINNMAISIDGAALSIGCTIVTPYGEVTVNV
jgi:hypothetical protein